MKTIEQPEVKNFLSSIKERIAFKEAHPEIEQELSRHLEDLVQENMEKGEPSREALRSAIKRMGDPEEIGQRLNRVHTPRTPWVLLAIVVSMIGLGIVNVVEFHRLGSHAVNILIGAAAGLLLYWAKPSRISKVSALLFAGGLAFLGAAALWGERFEGVPYIKFLCFNIDAADFTLVPLIIAYGGLVGRTSNDRQRKGYVLAAISVIPVLGLSLIGSSYGAILFAVASLAMMVAASFGAIPMLLSALAYSLTIGLTLSSQKFLSAEAFELARASEAHTDFVLTHFHEKSSLLGALGIFLAMAVVSQLGTLLTEVRSQFARVIVAGHLAILALGIAWSVLANIGYVAMPGSGAPLPFVSYGGSLLIGQMALMGISAGLYRRRTLSLLSET